MNARFPSLVILGLIVAVLATIINKWVFMVILAVGGVALAVIVWKLVDRGLYTPPTILFDEAKDRFTKTATPASESVDADEAGTHGTRTDEQ